MRPLASRKLVTAKRMVIRTLNQLLIHASFLCNFGDQMLRRLLREDSAEMAFLDLFQ